MTPRPFPTCGLLASLLAFLLAAVSAPPAQAQRTDARFDVVCVANPDAAKITARKACLEATPVVTFGSQVTLAVEHAPEADFADETAPDPSRLVLFLEGKALPGARARVGKSEMDPQGVTTTLLTFRLIRDLSSEPGRRNWKDVLVAARNRRILAASTGLENGNPAATRAEVEFVVIERGKLVLWFVIAIVFAAAFFWVAVRTALLRDSEPLIEGKTPMKDTDRAYSLARVQMAVWTVVVLYSFLYVWCLTREFNGTIPPSALILMGISAGTLATAAGVDSQKLKTNKQNLEEKKAKPAAQQTPALQSEIIALETQTHVCKSEGFFLDILTSAEGSSLHRLQFVVWTVALIAVFVVGVWNDVTLPDFDATLLGLMGIASGAYVGLKLPEAKT